MPSDIHDVLVYISALFVFFLSLAILCFCIRVFLWVYLDYWRPGRRNARNRDRQGNIYTVSDDIASNNVTPRFPDFFYLEPGSDEAARIRAQLEKDDKELPSYEEVLRMTNLTPTPGTTVAALPAAMPPMPAALGVSNTSFVTTATDLPLPPAPPYTEIDINATIPVATATDVAPHPLTSVSTANPASIPAIAPSTSRAAASLVITSPLAGVTTATSA